MSQNYHCSPLEFDNYKDFLKKILKDANTRGFKRALAEAGHFQPAYLSQVLGGDKHFSLDQGYRLGVFLGCNDEECWHLLQLIEWARAEDLGLKKIFRERIQKRMNKESAISKRVKREAKSLSAEEKTIYYSNWLIPILHMAATKTGGVDLDEISKQVAGTDLQIHSAIQNLTRLGLIQKKGRKFEATDRNIHIEVGDIHHRLLKQSVDDALRFSNPDVQYVSFAAFSQEEYRHLKQEILDVITKHRKAIPTSESERVVAFSVGLSAIFDL